ncbi:MAG TPA: putative baseplate assembly protein [Kofleriaceae bacterium]
MPIRPPALDDRSFPDLVQEVLARIPAHVPEWQPRIGDPGRTLVELFAWLTDTLLYRANLIPEKQRLQFLRLLQLPMQPATAARGVVSLTLNDDDPTPVTLRKLCTIKGPSSFETLDEVTLLPVTAACYFKRQATDDEQASLGEVLDALPLVYDLGNQAPTYYVTTPVFVGGAAEIDGLDLVRDTVDGSLWIALIARKPELVDQARQALGPAADGGSRLLSVGYAPAIAVVNPTTDVSQATAIPHVWEITTGKASTGTASDYLTLERNSDTTNGLTTRGVRRLVLPSADNIGVPDADLTDALKAGVGDRPPRIDDATLAGKLVAWVRLRPSEKMDSFRVSWVGINAVEVENRKTLTGKIIGASTGNADQSFTLPAPSVEASSLVVQVESPEGFVPWVVTTDLALADRDDEVFTLDQEAGSVSFGDGVRGRVPPTGMRVRVDFMRAGGGAIGNLAPNTLKQFDSVLDATSATVTRPILVAHGLPTDGGSDSESLADAERRIPAWLRHRDRAVTKTDYQEVAAETPGVALGRIEIMPQFKPQQRRQNVPGVVSVVVWPQKSQWQPPNPRADRPLIEAVHAWLDDRRPLATELYVIGCEYIPLAVSAGVTLRDGAPRDEVLAGVRDAIRRFLWPLMPGGPDGTGWPLGRTVKQRELEVVVAQVGGVSEVTSVNLFMQENSAWTKVPGSPAAQIALDPWQLPEVLAVIADVGDPADDPSTLPNPYGDSGVAIPVVPEVC